LTPVIWCVLQSIVYIKRRYDRRANNGNNVKRKSVGDLSIGIGMIPIHLIPIPMPSEKPGMDSGPRVYVSRVEKSEGPIIREFILSIAL
jgi:hypothetical protein